MRTVEEIIQEIQRRAADLERESYEFDVSNPGQDQCLVAMEALVSLQAWINTTASTEEKADE